MDMKKFVIEQACQKLCTMFCFLIDTRQYEAFTALFREDGTFIRPGAKLAGRTEILNSVSARPRTLQTVHSCGLPVITVTSPTTAVGHVPFIFMSSKSQNNAENGKDHTVITMAGYYRDHYSFTNHGWKIASREVEPTFPAAP